MERWDGDALTPIESGKRRIDQIGDLHHAGQRVHIHAGMAPDLGPGRGGKHGLDIDAFWSELETERLREMQDEGLGRAINRHAKLGGEADRRADIDYGSLACPGEPRRDRMSEPHERGRIERHQPVDIFNVLFDEGATEAHPCVVDEDANLRVIAQPRFDFRALARVGQIRGQYIDRYSGLAAQALGKLLHPRHIAGNQHEVMAPPPETLGIGGADAGGGAGDENGGVAVHDIAFRSIGYIYMMIVINDSYMMAVIIMSTGEHGDFAMKVSREQMAQNRIRILTEAGRLFREKGFAAVSVAEVMKAAGLTHGGFYGHFKSKDDLIAQAIAHATGSGADAGDLAAFIDAYLSLPHSAHPELGCPMAAFAGLMRDQAPEARAAMALRLAEQIESMSDAMPGKDAVERRRAAIGSWAAMVGALILARSIDDPTLSGELLAQTRAWIEAKGLAEVVPSRGGAA